MIKYIFLLIIIFAAFTNTDIISQNYRFELSGGLSTFQMETLKGLNQDLNTDAKQRLNLNTQITDNFPAFLWYNLEIKRNFFNKFNIGGVIGLVSTGSRISYADYSGKYSLDNNVYGINLGLVYDFLYEYNENINYDIGIESGVIFSNLTSKEKYVIENTAQEFNYVFSATSIYLKAEGKVFYKINDNLKLGLSLGYLFDINAKYHLTTNANAILTRPSDNSTVKTEWSGIRSGIVFSYSI
jgi:hypothetical protein